MFLSRLAVKRPITIIMITLAVIILGYVSLAKLPIDLLPNLEIPISAVSIYYRGVGPKEIENLITIPLEGAISTVSNVQKVRSVSSEGRSLVIAEFKFGTDMDMAVLEIREKVDLIKRFLPNDIGSPVFLKLDPNSIPIIEISISGSADLFELQDFAKETLKPQLERLEGVAAVDVAGGFKKEIEIIVNTKKMQQYGLTIENVSALIAAENLNLPGGTVVKGNQQLTIRTVGQFQSIDDIRNLKLMLRSGKSILLSDIAEIQLINNQDSGINRVNGARCINVAVRKQSGTNTVAVAKEVLSEIESVKAKYQQFNIVPIINQAEYIQRSINQLIENAVLGSILAIAVLFFFFKNIRTTLIIAVAIPISIIGTFVLLYFNGITLNLMTLGGLALAIGMLVDNAIVVLENIFRMREEGRNSKKSAVYGAGEVAMAVTASTLTTVAVFLPIVFIEGITSEIFRELALTVTLSLFASLVISLTLIPMMASKLIVMRKTVLQPKDSKSPWGGVYQKFVKKYRKILAWSLDKPYTILIIGITIFVLCISSLYFVGAEYFPEMDRGEFTINANFPPGTILSETEKVTSEIESLIINLPETEVLYSSINNGLATITVLTTGSKQASRSTAQVADEARNLLKDIAGVDIDISVSSMMASNVVGTPISISVQGKDLKVLEKISDDFVDIVSNIEGTRMVSSGLSTGIPEIEIKVNRLKASQYGLTTAQIANTVRTLMNGKTVTRYKLNGTEIDVNVVGEKKLKTSVSRFKQLTIMTPLGTAVPLLEVAEIQEVVGPQSISREGQIRVAQITSQIFLRDLNAISNEIKVELAKYQMPGGYSYEVGGEFSEMVKSLRDLSQALLLSVLLVYMVLASQFESLLYPFIIMFAVPLSFSGGALGLFLTGKALSVPGMIGAMILAGVVVNDAIVLIDYINTRRERGEDRLKAIINAGAIRLRPILITTLTTVLGLIPLALGLGEGSEALAPMAITVIFGLSLATVLTLIFIPIVYLLIDNLRTVRSP